MMRAQDLDGMEEFKTQLSKDYDLYWEKTTW